MGSGWLSYIMCINTYIHPYIYIERERDIHITLCICIDIQLFIHSKRV